MSQIQEFIYEQLGSLINDQNRENFRDLFPILFHQFINILFEQKPNNKNLLYVFGIFHQAFYNILDFDVSKETIEFIKKNLLEGLCESKWVDTVYLEGIYNSLEIPKKNELRFLIRNLILLARRNLKNKFSEDIKIKMIIE